MLAAIKGTLIEAFFIPSDLFHCDEETGEPLKECPLWVLEVILESDEDGFGNFVYTRSFSDKKKDSYLNIIPDQTVLLRNSIGDVAAMDKDKFAKRFVVISEFTAALREDCVSYYTWGKEIIFDGYNQRSRKLHLRDFMRYFVPPTLDTDIWRRKGWIK